MSDGDDDELRDVEFTSVSALLEGTSIEFYPLI